MWTVIHRKYSRQCETGLTLEYQPGVDELYLIHYYGRPKVLFLIENSIFVHRNCQKCNNFYKAIPKFSCVKPTLGQKFLQAIDYICRTFILYSKWLQKVHILYNNVHLVLLTINWK